MQPAGTRNCLCSLMEESGSETDARGEIIPSPREVTKLWCSIQTASTSKPISFSQQYPTATLVVVTLWTRSITPTPAMWLEYRGRKLDIVGLENRLEENKEWWLACTEQVPVRD